MSIGSSSVNSWGPWVLMALIRKEESFCDSEKIEGVFFFFFGRKQVDHMSNRAGGTWLSGFMSVPMASLAL